ncbi:MAG: hypothetical protein H0X24_14000 [Ktedonobacterales bacterium]|nr:hypothetical protein [Ktedonobacterales bacterium]
MNDVQGYMARFLNRHDTYCLQTPDGRYTRRYQRVTEELVTGHLLGHHTLACDAMDIHGFTQWLCFDHDGPDGLARLDQLQDRLAFLGVVTLREASRRGGHLWLLTADSVPAAFLRHLAQLALRVVGFTCEIYPDKDKGLGLKGLAHPVRLPLGIHQLTQQRYPFLDVQGRPVHGPDAASGLAWILGQHRNSLTFLHAAVAQLEMAIAPDPPVFPRASRSTTTGLIAWVNEQLDLREVVAKTRPEVGLREAGKGYIGWCPWHDDTSVQYDGTPGTPSLYVVRDRLHGWSWRCLSTNCGANSGPLHHTFDWLLWHQAGQLPQAMALANEWKGTST